MAAPDESIGRLTRFVSRVVLEWDLDATGCQWQTTDGSLVFLDISGFTRLSERLARRGRIGTEELTEVLGTVFGSMLDLSFARGGGLLKFGGDALLLLFLGDDHAREACGAAVEMRAALREATRVRTSVGRVQLRMSVGVHSGTLHLFRVGGSHHELVIAGEGADETARMEALAGPGQVVVSHGTKLRLPNDATRELTGGGWLLRWRHSPFAGGGPIERRSVSGEIVTMGLPALLRSELTDGAIESEHRLATVGFVKVSGIDRLLTHGPNAVADALDEVVSKVQEASEGEEVTFLASDIDEGGFKIILATGVPTSRGDDSGRMLRALRRIVDAPLPLPVRAGVNRGHVYAGEIGTSHRSAYTVMGDTVNLAARLMAKAPYGAIYATASPLAQAHTVFATELLEPFPVKGKTELIQAYAVGGEIGLRQAASDGDLPMTGREDEQASLRSALSAATAGVGACLTLVGDVGLGKTRLVAEALHEWDGGLIEVRGEPNGASSPFRALRDGLRAAIGVTRGMPDEMAKQLHSAVARIAPELMTVVPLLGEVTSIDVPATSETAAIDPTYRAERRAAALASLLDAMLPGPSVIVIEDAHWLDEASTEVLTHLVAAAGDRPWLVVVTRRDEPGGFRPSSGAVLDLAPMTRTESRALAHAATEAAPLWPHEIDAIIDRAGGSPLFLNELLRLGRATGFAGTLPDSLDAAMNVELDRLPPVSRRLVRTAAVLGRSFRAAVLADLLAADGIVLDDALGPDLDVILDQEGPDRITFRHAMLRDVAYEGLPYRRRRELHMRAAAAIERAAQPHPEVVADALAFHFSLAHDHARTWDYARVAGDRARDAYANVEAVAHYEQALIASRHMGAVDAIERADVWEALATVRDNAGQLEAADAAYRSALRLVPAHSPRAGWLFERRAWVSQRRGDMSRAIRLVRRGVRLLDADPTVEARRCRARLFAREAVIRRQQGRSEDAMDLTRIAIAEATASGDRMTLARSYLTWDWCLLDLGRLDEAVHAREALEIYAALGELRERAGALNNLGAAAYWSGDWDTAIDLYGQAAESARKCGGLADAAIFDANIAEVYVNQGRLDEAERLLHSSLRLSRAAGWEGHRAFEIVQLGRIAAARSDNTNAISLLEEAAALLGGVGEARHAAQALLHLALVYAHTGRVDDAEHIIVAVGPHIGDSHRGPMGVMFDRVCATVLARRGDHNGAREVIRSAVGNARADGLLYELSTVLDLARRLDMSDDLASDAELVELSDRLGISRSL